MALTIVIGLFSWTWLAFLAALVLPYHLAIPLTLGVSAAVVLGWNPHRRARPWWRPLEGGRSGWILWGLASLGTVALLGPLFWTHSLPRDSAGVWTAGSTWADFGLHATIISHLTVFDRMPLDLPVASGAQLTYPFLIDYLSALYLRDGWSLHSSLFLPGSAASARPSRPAAWPRGSSSPAINSAASTVAVSAQVATCGRPQRWPWWLRHPPLLAAIDLHIGGVHIDSHLVAQHRSPLSRQQRQHRGVDLTDPGLHRPPLPLGEPPGQPGRGRGTHPATGPSTSPGHIRAIAIQPDQEILPDPLRTRHPDQQLRAGQPPIPGLDRPDRRVQQRDHAQPGHQLGHRHHPRKPSHRRIRRADPHHPPQPTDLTYSIHLIGALPPR